MYAVGLYVDPKAAKHLLNSKQAGIVATSGVPEQAVFDGESCHLLVPAGQEWVDSSPSTCTSSTAVHGKQEVHESCHLILLRADLVKSNEIEKSLRMVISFGGVNQKNFWSALQERLEPPMKKVRKAWSRHA